MGEFFALIMPAGDEATDLLVAALSNPSWQESYAQFYGNIGQIGVLAVLFMYMGTVQREVKSGTASLMFSKGLGFGSFILAKFTIAVILTTIVTVISTIVTYVYTFLLFDEAGQFGHVLVGSLIFSIGALMLLSIIILCSSLTKSSAASGGMSFGVYFILIITSAIPRIGSFSPFQLFNHPAAMSVGYFSNNLMVNILIAIGVSIIALLFAVERLKRAEG